MAKWRLVLDLGRHEGPTYQRIARAIIEDIRRGRLGPGDPLPGSRALSSDLGVNRNTVKAAYDELTTQGWIATRPSSGTFVSAELPERLARRIGRVVAGAPDAMGFPLPAVDLPPPDIRSALGGARIAFRGIDMRLVPREVLARAYRHALASKSDVLGYSSGRGHPRLLAALGAMLATTRGIPAGRSILVTRGSQMALYLAIRAIFRPGDAVAVEDPGYSFAWPAFRAAGVELVPIAVDQEGLRVDRLVEALGRGSALRAVMVTPHLQYPTGLSLSPQRRAQLLEIARRHRLAILEDDFVQDMQFEGRPNLPLASVDTAGTVVYLGSFSKTFAPTLRLGFVVGPEPVIDRIARLRASIDVCGDAVTEVAMADLLEDGEVQRHLRRITRVYRRRRDTLVTELERRLGSAVAMDRPVSGGTLWVRVDPQIDVEAWAAAGEQRGVGFLTGRRFFFDGRSRPFLWLGFGGLQESVLVEAVALMAAALKGLARR